MCNYERLIDYQIFLKSIQFGKISTKSNVSVKK